MDRASKFQLMKQANQEFLRLEAKKNQVNIDLVAHLNRFIFTTLGLITLKQIVQLGRIFKSVWDFMFVILMFDDEWVKTIILVCPGEGQIWGT